MDLHELGSDLLDVVCYHLALIDRLDLSSSSLTIRGMLRRHFQMWDCELAAVFGLMLEGKIGNSHQLCDVSPSSSTYNFIRPTTQDLPKKKLVIKSNWTCFAYSHPMVTDVDYAIEEYEPYETTDGRLIKCVGFKLIRARFGEVHSLQNVLGATVDWTVHKDAKICGTISQRMTHPFTGETVRAKLDTVVTALVKTLHPRVTMELGGRFVLSHTMKDGHVNLEQLRIYVKPMSI